MSLIKSNAVQIGQSNTATENFTLVVPSPQDGTIKLARGNAGATTQDVLSVDASGNVGFGTYTNTPSTIVGYITIKDISGTPRKLAVVS